MRLLAIASGSIEGFMKSEADLRAKMMLTPKADMCESDDDEEEDQSDLLNIYDNVAVIDINGGLTATDSWINKYYGLVSYGEIREAIIQAVQANVGCIFFNVNSPGGDVNGMSDVASLISSLPMPTIAFSSSQMASAAYFLGCQADNIYVDSFADVGSIGVVINVMDYTAMNKMNGVVAQRFRSGSLKGTGNPNFALSKEEQAYIQGKVDTYSGMFFQIVSDARGMDLPTMNKLEITTGRTFIGQQAAAANLVDGMLTFDQSMAKAYDLATKYVDKQNVSGIQFR